MVVIAVSELQLDGMETRTLSDVVGLIMFRHTLLHWRNLLEEKIRQVDTNRCEYEVYVF